MALAHVPDPDLVIRTGGELRISNFLLWQAAYSELYFSDKLWPELRCAAIDEAIADYARRERRFGRTSEQVARTRPARAGRPPEGGAAMLKQRVITAVVLLAILLPALFWKTPQPFLAAVTLVLIAAGGWEWGRLNGLGQGGSMALGLLTLALCAAPGRSGWTASPLRCCGRWSAPPGCWPARRWCAPAWTAGRRSRARCAWSAACWRWGWPGWRWRRPV